MGQWNGLALQTEISAKLGDTSAGFKSRVIGWLNDVHREISALHDWPNLLSKGQVLLESGKEDHDLFPCAPGRPTVTLATGTGLTSASKYRVRVTFSDGKYYESMPSVASTELTATGTTLSIALTNIPISDWPLCVERKIYVSKDSASFYYHGTIKDNTTTTYTVSSETSSLIEPPEYEMIRKVLGAPFIESSSRMEFKPVDQLRLLFEGTWSTGQPSFWSHASEKAVKLYPIPSGYSGSITKCETSDAGAKTKITSTAHGRSNADIVGIRGTGYYNGKHTVEQVTTNTYVIPVPFIANDTGSWLLLSGATTLSFYYFGIPFQITAEETSIPRLPISFKTALEAGVVWKGFEYRDRDGQETKARNYYQLVSKLVSFAAIPAKVPKRVRDMVGDCDGFEY
jgi:hypothetical protein